MRNRYADTGHWYSRDTQAVADAKSLSARLLHFFIDIDTGLGAGNDFPRDGLTVIAFRNAHLSYALTWFALAGISVIGLVLLLRERRQS